MCVCVCACALRVRVRVRCVCVCVCVSVCLCSILQAGKLHSQYTGNSQSEQGCETILGTTHFVIIEKLL